MQTLLVQDIKADGSKETTEDTNAGAEDGTATFFVQIDQEGEPEPAAQTNQAKSNEDADLYNKLINNLLSQQQNVITNSQTSASASEPIAQPSWNDPQIHISSASGKSATSYLNICDFVQSSVEEEVILWGQGDQQIIVKSGPKKPRLENLTLCQWSVANLSILYKLVGENKLVRTALMDSCRTQLRCINLFSDTVLSHCCCLTENIESFRPVWVFGGELTFSTSTRSSCSPKTNQSPQVASCPREVR